MEPRNGYSSGRTIGGKVGCASAVLIGLPVFFLLTFARFYGYCPPQGACHDNERLHFIAILLITAATAAVSGVVVRWVVNRLNRTDR